MTVIKIEGQPVVRKDGTKGWTEALTVTKLEKPKNPVRVALDRLLGKK